MDEKRILTLNPVVDAYGVGTSITNARVIDFAMDIIEIDGKPLAKRGKMSGAKTVFRCSKCFQDKMVPSKRTRSIYSGCGSMLMWWSFKELLSPLIQNRKILWDLPNHRQYENMFLNNFLILIFRVRLVFDQDGSCPEIGNMI